MLALLKALPATTIRLAVGNTLAAKQDRANNAARMARLISLRAIDDRPLTKIDFVRVGEMYDVAPWKLHGLADQEVPNGNGFSPDGRLVVVPELHQWTKRTKHAYDKTNPEFFQEGFVAPSKVGKDHPYRQNNLGRWDILARMAALDFDRALESTSFGAFQFMGFNWRKLTSPSYENVGDVVQYLYSSQRAQLDIAIRLLIADGGFEALRAADNGANAAAWIAFAKVQNGTARPVAYASEVSKKAEARKVVYA